MNETKEAPTATLPELEHLLLRAARRQAAVPRGFGRRRWFLAAAAASLLVVGGAAAAISGVFQVDGGRTAAGTYSIESRVVPSGSAQTICLQLSLNAGPAAYGCGDRPSTAVPFGLLIADALDGGGERVVYGLVSDEIASVRVLGGRGSEVEPETAEKPGLPGRFFSAVTPNDGRLELVGFSSAGEEIARLGSVDPPADPPRSKAEAMAQGDPAGFGPTSPTAAIYLYKGERIAPSTATRLQLACLQGVEVIRCFDSEAEMNARAQP